MALGLCCHYVETYHTPTGTVRQRNAFQERRLQLGRWRRGGYTEAQVRNLYLDNLTNLATTFSRIVRDGYRCFRFSSSLLPLADIVPRAWWDNDLTREQLDRFGSQARQHGIRITTHPGQFCVLSSDTPRVVDAAITELSINGWMMDCMGLDRSPYYSINVHGGKRGRMGNLIDSIGRLPPEVLNRLTLENCERAYGVLELAGVSRETGVPVVVDSHHHTFRDNGLDLESAIELATVTWQGIKPLQHLSNSEPDCPDRLLRAHSRWVHSVPTIQYSLLEADTVDIEMEFKMKNLAIQRAIHDGLVPHHNITPI